MYSPYPPGHCLHMYILTGKRTGSPCLWNRNAGGRWPSRQVRYAVRTAASLVVYLRWECNRASGDLAVEPLDPSHPSHPSSRIGTSQLFDLGTTADGGREIVSRKCLSAFVGHRSRRGRRCTKEELLPSEPAHARHGCWSNLIYCPSSTWSANEASRGQTSRLGLSSIQTHHREKTIWKRGGTRARRVEGNEPGGTDAWSP